VNIKPVDRMLNMVDLPKTVAEEQFMVIEYKEKHEFMERQHKEYQKEVEK
jgi:hypothetical protein